VAHDDHVSALLEAPDGGGDALDEDGLKDELTAGPAFERLSARSTVRTTPGLKRPPSLVPPDGDVGDDVGTSAVRAVHRSMSGRLLGQGSRPVSRVLSAAELRGGTAIHLGPPLPEASSGLPGDRRATSSPPTRPCSGWGLPGRRVTTPPVRSYRTVSPLPPHRPNPLREGATGRQEAVCFCGTFPGVTPGGCYPPPCPVEPGLSSLPRPGERPPGLLPWHPYYRAPHKEALPLCGDSAWDRE